MGKLAEDKWSQSLSLERDLGEWADQLRLAATPDLMCPEICFMMWCGTPAKTTTGKMKPCNGAHTLDKAHKYNWTFDGDFYIHQNEDLRALWEPLKREKHYKTAGF